MRRESLGRGAIAESRGIFGAGRVRQRVPVRDAEVRGEEYVVGWCAARRS